MVFLVLFYLFLAFAAVSVIQAVLFCIQTCEHIRYTRSRLGHLGHASPVVGRAMVFVPCKGLDQDLEKNLSALFEQDYKDMEIRFLVESNDDPACQPLVELLRCHPEVDATILTTGIATTCGQKVHNLRVATEDIPSNIQYFVFMDSDAQPRREWLRAMLFRICNDPEPNLGAVTGYRWMVPVRASLGNYLVYAINSAVTILFGKMGLYPIWGGSWAILRSQFEDAGIRSAWEWTISDDLVAVKTLTAQGRRILFEPTSVVASPIDFSFSEAISFLRRQYTIGRIYMPKAWLIGLLCVAVPTIAWWGAFVEIVRRAIVDGQAAWGLIGFCVVIYATMVLRGVLRQRLASVYAKQYKDVLKIPIWFDILAGPIIALINTSCMFLSAIGSRLTWRRIIYTMDRKGTVRHIKRMDELSEIEAVRSYRRVA